MAWGEPVQSSGYLKWDKPKVIVGKYLGGEEKIGKNDKPNMLHSLDSDGEEVQFWGTTILNDLLGQIEHGTLLRIEYQGSRATEKGTLKLFVVQPWVADESLPGGAA